VAALRRRLLIADVTLIGRAMAGEPGVVEAHDRHVWDVSSRLPALAAHVVAGRDSPGGRVDGQRSSIYG
jgi:Co/Zn/Cd efflux system component